MHKHDKNNNIYSYSCHVYALISREKAEKHPPPKVKTSLQKTVN